VPFTKLKHQEKASQRQGYLKESRELGQPKLVGADEKDPGFGSGTVA